MYGEMIPPRLKGVLLRQVKITTVLDMAIEKKVGGSPEAFEAIWDVLCDSDRLVVSECDELSPPSAKRLRR